MRKNFLRSGLLTGGALLLVYAAFDDITTDNATAFPLEYSLLTICAAWLFVLGCRLLQAGRIALGGMSLAALVGALWAQPAIVRGAAPGWRPEYTVMIAAYAWFWVVTARLIQSGWHRRTAS